MVIPSFLFPRSRAFIYGATLPWTALRLILSRPVLMIWSIIPISVTLVLYFYLIRWLEAASLRGVSQIFVHYGWNPEGFGAATVLILTKILMILVAALSFSVSSSIVASPFNDWLAECAEPHAMPPLVPPKDVSWRMKARLVKVDVMKSIAALIGGVCAILMSWIPVVNIFAIAAAFLLITFQYTSYPQTRRGEDLRTGFRFLWAHVYSCLGLGATLSFLFAIPIVSSVFLPVAVVSGTLLYARAQAPVSKQVSKLK